MEIRHSSRARSSSSHRSVQTMDDVSTLTDRDEHALAAIRRQLDMEFPHWSGSVEPARNTSGKTAHSDEARSERRTATRARRAATVVGALLLAGAAGSAAGVLVTILYSKHVVAPTVDPEPPPPRPATVTRPPLPASPPVVPTARRTDSQLGTIVERPRLPTPTSTRSSRGAASVAPAPGIVPVTLSPSPPTTPLLAADPPSRVRPSLAEPSPATHATPNQFRRYWERYKRDFERAADDPTQKPSPVPETP